jgi:hypothetical protein
MYIYVNCNVKWSTQNTKYKVINQHINDMCHVQSLKKDFYLGGPSSFDHVFTPKAKYIMRNMGKVWGLRYWAFGNLNGWQLFPWKKDKCETNNWLG